MPQCTACATEIPEKSRFCLQCGRPAAEIDPDSVETVAVAMSHRHASPARERFAPGTLLAGRYRIISRLGKGGMGEVFRADDLVLGQPVALKFLPEAARGNLDLLARFYGEVRIARQISHKNVCRVYDVGEVEGQPYLSMEYIDGEDLGSLLRRIGRLPVDKATEFARKLCAGVAAAHAQGVLHRDLKPANIMIDSKGELRVTDFGLAALADQLQGAEIRNGTPAYMAPEQLAGKEVTVQSDVYALGLLLYEMFTGKMAFQADTLADMIRLREESRITNPSTLVGDMDKTVERAILRCLERDPRMRPQSALAVAASLPGGDPLAVALAEGETPSPEMVAAAGSTDALSPKIGIPVLAGIAIGIVAISLAVSRLTLINLVPMENPPDVLTAEARDIARSLGYTERPGDWAAGFFGDGANAAYLRAKGHNMEQWTRLFAQPPTGLGYWYRQSPTALVPERAGSNGETGATDPPVTTPGMVAVNIEIDGRLRRFVAVPPDREISAGESKPGDWAALFTAARLDMTQFKPVTPEWTPPVAADVRAAWTGPYTGKPDLPIRVEAASFHGRPVYFQILWPWSRSARLTQQAPSTSQTIGNLARYIIGGIVLIAAIWVALYNWRAGRGDFGGATRIGAYCASMSLIAWALGAHHVASQAEQGLLSEALTNAGFTFVEYWLFYLALEPWVRRYWPQTLITWSRLLAGRWRDPLVGRDLLFGTLFGILYNVSLGGFYYVLMRSGSPDFSEGAIAQLGGFRPFSQMIASHLGSEVGGSLILFLTLFLLRVLLRKQWLTALIWVAGWVLVRTLQGNPDSRLFLSVLYTLIYGILVVLLLRFGFFALVVTVFVLDTIAGAFLTADFSAWYGQSSLAVVILVAAMALWGFRLSLASRPLLPAFAPEK
jgi:predicted Ser/Thr protein kinase